MLIGPKIVIPAVVGNMTGTSQIISQWIDMRYQHGGAIQAMWTGNPAGVFSIQSSLDFSLNNALAIQNPGTWIDLGITMGPPVGSSGNALVDIALTGIPFIRLVYTNVSGTGTLEALIFGK